MIMKNDDKQGRNELCKCGSKKKFKKCCGAEPDPISFRDIVKCLYLLCDAAAKDTLAIPKGPIPFSRKLLAAVPDDVISEFMVANDKDFIVMTVKQPEKSVIIQADTTLIDTNGRDLKLSP